MRVVILTAQRAPDLLLTATTVSSLKAPSGSILAGPSRSG